MRGRVVGTWGGGEGQTGTALHRLEIQLASPVDMQVLLQQAQVDLRFSFANQPQGLQDRWSTDHTVARTGRQRKPRSRWQSTWKACGELDFIPEDSRKAGRRVTWLKDTSRISSWLLCGEDLLGSGWQQGDSAGGDTVLRLHRKRQEVGLFEHFG